MGGHVLTNIGKMVIAAGILMTLVGLIVYAIGRLGGAGQGLPGDLTFRWGNTTFYLPLATSIIASIILSVVLTIGMYIAGWFRS